MTATVMRCSDAQTAADLTAETFAHAFASRRRFRDTGAPATAVSRRVADELPYADVALALGCTEAAARVRVSRGLSRLADLLTPPTIEETA